MARLFRRILVPHDFSRPAGQALRLAARLAAGGGRLHVLHVIAPFAPVTAHIVASRTWIPEGEVLADAYRRLNALVERTLGPRRPPTRVEVVIGDPMLRIVAAAKKADLIVMSTTGRTGLPHLVIGSVAEKVVRHAPVPVLTVRAGRRASR